MIKVDSNYTEDEDQFELGVSAYEDRNGCVFEDCTILNSKENTYECRTVKVFKKPAGK